MSNPNVWTGSGSGPTVNQDEIAWNPNFQNYGNTYLIWGTDGVLQKYLVTSFANKDRIIEVNVEQGAGFTADVILMLDGQDFEIEVIDTTQYAPPTIGQNPFAIIGPFGTCTVLMVAQNGSLARKREGMRSWTFRSYTAINLGVGTAL